jgi:hypothetical protein
MRQPTICLDFDGVLHGYSQGWHDGTIYDPPTPGSVAAVRRLYDHGYNLVVCSCRASAPKQREDIRAYVRKHYGIIVTVSDTKPPAVVYIDDRAVEYRGDWDEVLEKVEERVGR